MYKITYKGQVGFFHGLHQQAQAIKALLAKGASADEIFPMGSEFDDPAVISLWESGHKYGVVALDGRPLSLKEAEAALSGRYGSPLRGRDIAVYFLGSPRHPACGNRYKWDEGDLVESLS